MPVPMDPDAAAQADRVRRVLEEVSVFLEGLFRARVLTRARLDYSAAEEADWSRVDPVQVDSAVQRLRQFLLELSAQADPAKESSEPEDKDVSNEDKDDESENTYGGSKSSLATRKRPNRCRQCRRQFATQALLEHHVAHAHSGAGLISESAPTSKSNSASSNFLCCQLCFECHRSPEDFSTHQCTRSSASTRVEPLTDSSLLEQHNRFLCGYCQEEFHIFSRAALHLAKCRGPPFECGLCGEGGFGTRRALDGHKASAHSDELPFRCEECPRKFKLRNSLRKHINLAHEGGAAKERARQQQRLVCRLCKKKFIKKLYLTIHMSRWHRQEVPKCHLCDVCGGTFASANSLRSHKASHSEEKYCCKVCQKSFWRKDKLKFHEAVHSGEKPHKCTQCTMRFISKAKLNEHLRRHSGQKRFACVVCSKLYSGSHALRKHLRVKHPQVGKNIKPNVPLTPQMAWDAVPKKLLEGGGRSRSKRKAAAAAAAAMAALEDHTAIRHDTTAEDFTCAELEDFDLGALNAAEVDIEELERSALVVVPGD